MTQIGHYATIVKEDLKGYSIVQDSIYNVGVATAVAQPVDTHTFLETGAADKATQQTLTMSERTCFLHAAAMRSVNKTNISINCNGRDI
jgi:hypothetical protein